MTNTDDPDGSLRMYETMVTIQFADEKFRAQILGGEFAIPYYSPRGQEAVAAGIAEALQPGDYMVTTYRGIHDHIAKGVPLGPLWAEFTGKAGGLCKGKGGPMHVTHPESGTMVTTGIVGGGLPIANGLALASVLTGDGRVTICCFGDGASNIGGFHEALNLASVWRLPVVFVCQNNRYAESTPYALATSVARVSDRAVSYSMPGHTINGNDPRAVRDIVGGARARGVAGEGPTLVEAETFRYFGHYFGDQAKYIPEAELDDAMAHDPVPRFRQVLIDEGHTDGELEDIEQRARAAVDEASEFARNSPSPDQSDFATDVYAAVAAR